jgi:hypothetical protein
VSSATRRLTVCALVVVAACSGSGESSPPAGSTSTTTTTTTTTAATTSTSTTTTSTSTTTSSTLAPPPTTSPLESEMQAALEDYLDALLTCGERPSACDPTFVAPGSKTAEATAAFMQRLIDNDQYISEDRRGAYATLTSIESSSPDQTVTLSCWYDPTVRLGPPGPDGQPTLVDAKITSRIVRHVFERVDERWLVASQETVEVLAEGRDACAG